jgi:predicted dehydrogenase
MLVKFFRKKYAAPGEEYVAQCEMDSVPRSGDWISINPDSGSETVDLVTFCLPHKGHAAYAIVLLRASK